MVALGLVGLGLSCVFDPFVPETEPGDTDEECVFGSVRCVEFTIEECSEDGEWFWAFDCETLGMWCEEDGSTAVCNN
jgi:hypothetical protein